MKQPKLSHLKIDQTGTRRLRQAAAGTHKIKITINLDSDILTHLRQKASKRGSPYQTYLNNLLREAISKNVSDDDRLEKLEKEVALIKKKLAA